MRCVVGDVVWLQRDSRLVNLRGRVGTNLGNVEDIWTDDDGESISVVYEDEQVLAVDLSSVEFVIEQFAGGTLFLWAPRITPRTSTPRSRARGAL